jgi:hypothetical protein
VPAGAHQQHCATRQVLVQALLLRQRLVIVLKHNVFLLLLLPATPQARHCRRDTAICRGVRV